MTGYYALSTFIANLANLLHGVYRRSDYERVVLPMLLLRRLDCVLADRKSYMVAAWARLNGELPADRLELHLNEVAEQPFHNHSPLDLEVLKGYPDDCASQLRAYLAGFSPSVRSLFNQLGFDAELSRLDDAGILYLLLSKFCDVDLHPGRVSNQEMGQLFEEILRLWSVEPGSALGTHYTPPDVAQLAARLVIALDQAHLIAGGTVRLLDPSCGMGGLLVGAEEALQAAYPQLRVEAYGQELDERSYALATADWLLRGQTGTIRLGNTLLADRFAGECFEYVLANPPFGVAWHQERVLVEREYREQGAGGRFGAGLPRVSDGTFLFLQHAVAKLRPANEGGGRAVVVTNGSPLFTGSAGSGESQIRRWLFESDLVEAIIALPEQTFHNTTIGTYLWVISNRKEVGRQGKVQLIDARARWQPLRRSMGEKRREIGEAAIQAVLNEYATGIESETSRILTTTALGYQQVPVERPLRLRFEATTAGLSHLEATAPTLLPAVEALVAEHGPGPHNDWNIVQPFLARQRRWTRREWVAIRAALTTTHPAAVPVLATQQGAQEADPALRDWERVPLHGNVQAHFAREVAPYWADAWIDEAGIRVGYEVNFNRYFYRYQPPRPLAEIDAELRALEAQVAHGLSALLGAQEKKG